MSQYDPARNSYACWELAIACLRERHESAEPLTAAETLARVDARQSPTSTPTEAA
jgi:hypothetical protein